ncbi:MAG: LysM peptidoglycan-binding domain-containing protein, partial [Burkholderiales bacterium]|nr:LysM peptidoglycan-binding domain-containing protein [Flavobacterium sp.]
MKYLGWLFLILFLSSMSLFSQEKYMQHTVSSGETISEIAQEYNVKPSMIYELNPDAVNGIKGKTVLLIPTNTKQNADVATPVIASNLPEKIHEVLPKETLYGIAKQHHIAIEDLHKINPNLEKEGLKTGQTIKIPQTALEDFVVAKEVVKPTNVEKSNVSKKNIPKEEPVVAPKKDEKLKIPTQEIEYEVLPKETLYSITKKYGIKLADLQNANPALGTKSLQVGQKITVPIKEGINLSLTTEKVVEQKEVKPEKEVQVKTKPIEEQKESTTQFIHEVLPKESLYSIAKQYKITLADLQKANPILCTKSLKVGQKINVSVKADTNSILVAENKEVKIEKEIAVVSQNIKDKTAATEIAHEVLPKETKYGIAKQYGLTVAELEIQNPNISNKLLVGSVLKIRGSKLIVKEIFVENPIASEVPNTEQKFESKEANTVRDADFINQLISKAAENIGTRYRSGGTTPEGFDCSGFMYYTFSN